jgi:hypothetical protein
MSGFPDSNFITVTHGGSGRNAAPQAADVILITPTGGSQTTLANALGNTVGGPFLPLTGGVLHGNLTWSGAPSGWSGSNFGKQLLITGGGNPAIALTNAAASNYVAVANVGAGAIQNFVVYAMPSYADNFTAPASMMSVTNAGVLTLGASNTGGIVGTATNNNAAAGQIGEFISSNIPGGSAISLTTNTGANITSISLTAGDWDLEGNVAFGGTTTALSLAQGWINTVSATAPTTAAGYAISALPTGAGANANLPTGRLRISIAATTTVYLGTLALFASGTCLAYGFIGARRVR